MMEKDTYTVGSRRMVYLKGIIGEWATYFYICDVLTERLKEEWDEVLYVPISSNFDCLISSYKYEVTPVWIFKDLLDLFIYEGFLPSLSLLYSLYSKGVENMTCIGGYLFFIPDGIILKLGLGGDEDRERIEREYEERYFSDFFLKKVKDFEERDQERMIKEYKRRYSSGFLLKRIKELEERLREEGYSIHLDGSRNSASVERTLVSLGALPEEIITLRTLRPVIRAEVELVEVKMGKARLSKNEREHYLKCLKRGVPIRIISVKMEDLDKGIFKMAQVLLKNPEDLDAPFFL